MSNASVLSVNPIGFQPPKSNPASLEINPNRPGLWSRITNRSSHAAIRSQLKPALLAEMRRTGCSLQAVDMNRVTASMGNISLGNDEKAYLNYKVAQQTNRLNAFYQAAVTRDACPPVLSARQAGTVHKITAVPNKMPSDTKNNMPSDAKEAGVSFYELPDQLNAQDIEELESQGYKPDQSIAKTATLGQGQYGVVKLARKMDADADKAGQWSAHKIVDESPKYKHFLSSEREIARALTAINKQSDCHVGFAALDTSDVYEHGGNYQVQLFCELAQIKQPLSSVVSSRSDEIRFALVLTQKLSKLHAASVAHQDIKPDNIMLDKEKEPTFTDFGFATRKEKVPSADGSMRYNSPECYRSDSIDTQAKDVYSLALTILECIGEKDLVRPLDRVLMDPSTSEIQKVNRLFELRERAFIQQLQQPSNLREVLLTALDPNPATRPTAVELGQAIDALQS